MMDGIVHQPVLGKEAIEHLAVRPGGTYVDCTVGEGGHSEMIAPRIGRDGLLVIIDRDPEMLRITRDRLSRFGTRIVAQHLSFDALDEVEELEDGADGILFDFGVSSRQLDDPGRGLSYWGSGPLDMRLDPTQALTAADIVNGWSERELGRIIGRYGEERWASRIAAFIVRARARKPLVTADELVEAIKAAVPASARRQGGHPARKTFQALRIATNDELEAIERALPKAVDRLVPDGRLVTISYHSLEDRICKQTFSQMANCRCPRELPTCSCGGPVVEVMTRRPIRPGPEEQQQNPRARSARLRCVRKTRPPA